MSTIGFPSTSLRQSQPTTSQCSPWLTPLAYFLGKHLVLPMYFRHMTFHGQENIPLAGPVILAPTHRARWDSLLLPLVAGRAATGRDLRFMVTSDEVTGIQGWFIRRLGGFAVNVRSPSISSLRHGINLLRQGEMLVIYPEGGIFRDNQVHRLKPGLTRLAIQAESASQQLDLKILPISIRYETPYPRWRGSVDVAIGKPLSVADYLVQGQEIHLSSESIKSTAQKLGGDLDKALSALSNQQAR